MYDRLEDTVISWKIKLNFVLNPNAFTRQPAAEYNVSQSSIAIIRVTKCIHIN